MGEVRAGPRRSADAAGPWKTELVKRQELRPLQFQKIGLRRSPLKVSAPYFFIQIDF